MTQIIANRIPILDKAEPTQNTGILGQKSKLLGKYKIEVIFEKGRTVRGPNLFGVQLMESGKLLNGGGDDMVHWCINADDAREGCGAPITSDNIRNGIALCPNCKKQINADLLTEIRIARNTTTWLSRELAKLFRQLNSNADIYLKYHESDEHYMAMVKTHGPEVASRLRGAAIYPLYRILDDISNGSELEKRFFAFLAS